MSVSSSFSPRNQSRSTNQLKQVRKAQPKANRLRAQVSFCRNPKVDLNLHPDMLG